MKITNSAVVYKMGPNNKPAAYAKSGDTIVFETMDCFSNRIKTEEDTFSVVKRESVNPATGPLYIEKAEPGDMIKVEILDISVGEQGAIACGPGFGVLGHKIEKEVTKIMSVKDGVSVFNSKITVPIIPMVGVIGTSPKDEEIRTGNPGSHGGNMDCNRVTKGSSIYLPVNVKGAMLAMGDLHAVMGDGEIVGCGVEIAGEVTVRVTVVKGEKYPMPFLVSGEEFMTIAAGKTLDEAAELATINMHDFLCQKLGMELHEAGLFLSVMGQLRICQVVNELKTARMELPLWILEKYEFSM